MRASREVMSGGLAQFGQFTQSQSSIIVVLDMIAAAAAAAAASGYLFFSKLDRHSSLEIATQV